jgi:hypothetical protein
VRLRLELDSDTTSRLIEQATAERRPVAWHAEVLLRRALKRPPLPPGSSEGEAKNLPAGAKGVPI